MATNTPQDDFHKTGVRMPRDLHAKIHEAAAGSGRSYNAEIVARLQGSFDFLKLLPFSVQDAVISRVEDSGCTSMAALENLVLAGQSAGGVVLNLKIGPGTTAKQVRDTLTAALKMVPDADLVFEREQPGEVT